MKDRVNPLKDMGDAEVAINDLYDKF